MADKCKHLVKVIARKSLRILYIKKPEFSEKEKIQWLLMCYERFGI